MTPTGDLPADHAAKPPHGIAGHRGKEEKKGVASSNSVNELKGGGWTESSSSATTFGVGWDVFGFNGSAQTGYSGTASIHFGFGVGGHICGVYDVPGGSPGILVGT